MIIDPPSTDVTDVWADNFVPNKDVGARWTLLSKICLNNSFPLTASFLTTIISNDLARLMATFNRVFSVMKFRFSSSFERTVLIIITFLSWPWNCSTEPHLIFLRRHQKIIGIILAKYGPADLHRRKLCQYQRPPHGTIVIISMWWLLHGRLPSDSPMKLSRPAFLLFHNRQCLQNTADNCEASFFVDVH